MSKRKNHKPAFKALTCWPALWKWSNRIVSSGGCYAGRHAAAPVNISGHDILGKIASGAGGRYPSEECGLCVL